MKDRVVEIDRKLESLDKKYEKIKKKRNDLREQHEANLLRIMIPWNNKTRDISNEMRSLKNEKDYILQSRCEHKDKTTRKGGDHYTEYWYKVCSDCGKYF